MYFLLYFFLAVMVPTTSVGVVPVSYYFSGKEILAFNAP